MMKRTIFTIGLLLCAAMISAQTPKDVKFRFTEANDLTMTGRLFPTILIRTIGLIQKGSKGL